jgi:hypothetical protein
LRIKINRSISDTSAWAKKKADSQELRQEKENAAMDL